MPEAREALPCPAGLYFGPTWTMLYAPMCASLWLAEEQGEDDEAAKRTSRLFFGAQLLLDALWT